MYCTRNESSNLIEEDGGYNSKHIDGENLDRAQIFVITGEIGIYN